MSRSTSQTRASEKLSTSQPVGKVYRLLRLWYWNILITSKSIVYVACSQLNAHLKRANANREEKKVTALVIKQHFCRFGLMLDWLMNDLSQPMVFDLIRLWLFLFGHFFVFVTSAHQSCALINQKMCFRVTITWNFHSRMLTCSWVRGFFPEIRFCHFSPEPLIESTGRYFARFLYSEQRKFQSSKKSATISRRAATDRIIKPHSWIERNALQSRSRY